MKRNLIIILAFFTFNLFGQTYVGWQIGGEVLSFQGIGAGTIQVPFNFVDINSYSALHADTYLSIPTPVVGNNEATHPDVWDMGAVWNGYRYWMAFTPLPTVDTDENENPCIVASNDKTTWVVPAGGTNPITPTPPVSYNSDTELYFENDSLYCFYRTWVQDPTNRPIIGYKASNDGITWTTERELDVSDYVVNTDLVSPSIVEFNGEYRMYAVDYSGTTPEHYTYYLTSSTLLGSYTGKTRITLDSTYTFLTNMWPLVEWYTWHPNINVYNNKMFMVVALRAELSSGQEIKETLWLAESTDGETFIMSKTPFITNRWTNTGLSVTPVSAWDGKYYRSAMLPKDVDGELGWDLWYGGFEGYREIYPNYIGYTEIKPIQSHITYNQGTYNTISASRQTQIDSANSKLGNYIFCDDFQRTETGLTTSSSGDAYTGSVSTFSVNNSLKISSATATGIIDLGVTDYEISIDAKINDANYITSPTGNGLVVYLKNISGGVFLKCSSSRQFMLQNSGTDIQNDYLIQGFIEDDINNYKWQIVGDNVKYYINNKLQLEFDVTNTNVSEVNKDAVMASTKFLLWFQNTNIEMFNITAKAL